MEAQILEQQKIIDFLAAKYERDTGRKIPIPSQLGQLLGDSSIIGTRDKIEDALDIVAKNKPATFNQAMEDLRLPKPEKSEKGKPQNKKKLVSLEPHNMIQRIDLSGFKQVSRSSIKELMESVALLPCVKAINLANNNITDDYSAEILSIFDNKAITHVDLSQNLMKKLGMEIGKKLKDECQHVMWIDLTQNDFTMDTPTVNMIINGLKKQKDLIYIGLSA